jgi:2-methylcitrate dehydratase PrpD
MFGSMCKSLHPGKAAQNGMSAALMAERGYTSSERAIEAKRGFAQVMSTRFDPTVITSGLGERYEIMQNMYKPFACGLVVHAVIDGCLQLRRDFDLKAADIKCISATVSPLVMELAGKQIQRLSRAGRCDRARRRRRSRVQRRSRARPASGFAAFARRGHRRRRHPQARRPRRH